MSDDFMSEISGAIESTGNPAPAPVTTNVTQTPSQEINNAVNNTGAQNVVADLEKMMGDELEVAPAAPAPKKTAEELAAEAAAKPDAKTDPKAKTDPRGKAPTARYLDTFLKEDAQGNFVTANGEVIATAGKSREYLEGLKREGRNYRDAANRMALGNAQLSEKFKELYTEYATVRDQKNSFDWKTETGFADNEAKEAVALMKEYKRDPINAIKMLLTSAKANGIDVSKIGANVTADPSVIKNMVQEMLSEQLAPLSQRATQEQQIASAQREVQDFFSEFPDAENFQEQIAAAKQEYPRMSLREIWLRFERALLARQGGQQQQRRTLKDRFSNRPNAKPLQRTVTMPTGTKDYTKMSFQEIAEEIQKDLRNA